MTGSGDQNGPIKLMRQGRVIFVTVNYRLGVFGYLSTSDLEIPGNFGLSDQITALNWVSKFISLFGGSNSRVRLLFKISTLFQHGFLF